MILKIHEPRGDTITNFIGDIVAELQEMPTHQVCMINNLMDLEMLIIFICICTQVQQILRIDMMITRMEEKCMAISMTAANAMLKESTVPQLKQAIVDIGGAVDFQVKYQGKACKSYIIPKSSLPSRVYSKLQECR